MPHIAAAQSAGCLVEVQIAANAHSPLEAIASKSSVATSANVHEAASRFVTAYCVARLRSVRTRPVMSRAIFDAPITLPVSSLIGETASETSNAVPSLRRQTVS